ncbi:MAG: LTA synthase family protein, partial [Clostridiales Family XIII bacterium]|nr:LTA synthase family protein [Clostridiales Family XIII bacterium]
FPIRSANLGNLPQIGYQYIAWNQIRNYNSNGFVVSFVSNLKEATMTKPEGYSREKVAEIVSRYQEQAKAANADRADLENEDIDIVFIMNESFSDPDRFKDIYPYTGISDELTPNLHRIADMAASGSIYSPRYGGGTANIEFEALTGFSTYFLGYAYPFQSMLPVMDSFPSIARVLGDYGSETLGLHPFGETMYRRNAVYPILGFDAFCGSLDFHHFRHDRGSLYISDQSAYEEVMDYLNGVRPIEAAEDADGGSGADGGSSQNPFDSWRAGASDAADFDTGDTGDAGAATDAPEGVDADGVDGIVDSEGAAGTEDAAGAGSKFITLITMQNHPAYGSQYRDHSFRSTAMDNVTYDTRLKINDYMELVHSSDEALGAFIDWAAGREKKTMVVFWGDHLPGIYDNVFFVDPALGYETPFFIYTNFDQRSSDLGSVSPNYISTLTLDSLGAKKPAFDYLLDELKAEVPILTAPYWEEAPPEETQAFSDYRIIEYDMMAGAGYSDDLGFFEVDRD